MKKRWFRQLFRRRFFVAVLLLIQLVVVGVLALTSIRYLHALYWVFTTVSFLVVLYLMKKHDKPAYRLLWILMILLVPVFGGLFYLLFRYQTSTKRFRDRLKVIDKDILPLLPHDDSLPAQLEDYACRLPAYLQEFARFPVFGNTYTHYLTPGEQKFDALMEQLRRAKRYIFLEYFIIGGGVMWNAILGVLKERAAAGVEVRLLYDDMGCFLLLPGDYPQTLEKMGIHCRVFSPFLPVMSSLQNNRDHRKIAVIDGLVAFTGGINLADEYINQTERFGHWKDSAIQLDGDAAWSFTLMFLEMWSLTGGDREDYSRFTPEKPAAPVKPTAPPLGYVQPYCDSPLDNESVGEHVYLKIITSAKHYLYINTPYLILDDGMAEALILSAKSGVDVRICTPQRWDKRLVHMTTRSYYRSLIRGGVRIFEYKDGFIHAKTFVSDDRIATVGTTNLDFRSLYLHFECGCCLYDTPSVADLKDDYLQTLELCREMTMDDCKCSWIEEIFQEILRIFAPLM